MRIVLFCHSLRSCWNHGNAHFLRGICSELLARGHDVIIHEPRDAWSLRQLVREHGAAPLAEFEARFPQLRSRRYWLESLDLDRALDGADLVIVHEWNDRGLIARIGAHRARQRRYLLLFHDTHHRMVSAPEQMAEYDLSEYDGVLAFGQVIRDLYLERGWAARAWTWHEAADTRCFGPRADADDQARAGDLVWIGNWGDGERTAELREYLLGPISRLRLAARVHGVRYPSDARAELEQAGIEYCGWLPNHRAPEVFARFRVTVHVPRRFYAEQLPGIPTIRVFEALACGIPLISSPWSDCEGLFTPDRDFLVARDGVQMQELLRAVLHERELAAGLAEHGRATLLAKHTCAHRVDELLAIIAELRQESEVPRTALDSSSSSRSEIATDGVDIRGVT